MILRLSGNVRSAHERLRTTVAGQAGVRVRRLSVIEFRGYPARRFGADAGGMAVLAQIARGHVGALFAHGFSAVVTTQAAGSDSGVIEVGAQPSGGQMAIAALESRHDVALVLAAGRGPVVADDAEAGHRQRNLRVIHGLGRIPAHHRMADFAGVAGLNMVRPLALGQRAVVATDAAPHHLGVIEVYGGSERQGVVAGGAIIRALDMRRRLRRRIVRRARDVAQPAVARRAFENGIQVTGLAR